MIADRPLNGSTTTTTSSSSPSSPTTTTAGTSTKESSIGSSSEERVVVGEKGESAATDVTAIDHHHHHHHLSSSILPSKGDSSSTTISTTATTSTEKSVALAAEEEPVAETSSSSSLGAVSVTSEVTDDAVINATTAVMNSDDSEQAAVSAPAPGEEVTLESTEGASVVVEAYDVVINQSVMDNDDSEQAAAAAAAAAAFAPEEVTLEKTDSVEEAAAAAALDPEMTLEKTDEIKELAADSPEVVQQDGAAEEVTAKEEEVKVPVETAEKVIAAPDSEPVEAEKEIAAADSEPVEEASDAATEETIQQEKAPVEEADLNPVETSVEQEVAQQNDVDKHHAAGGEDDETPEKEEVVETVTAEETVEHDDHVKNEVMVDDSPSMNGVHHAPPLPEISAEEVEEEKSLVEPEPELEDQEGDEPACSPLLPDPPALVALSVSSHVAGSPSDVDTTTNSDDPAGDILPSMAETAHPPALVALSVSSHVAGSPSDVDATTNSDDPAGDILPSMAETAHPPLPPGPGVPPSPPSSAPLMIQHEKVQQQHQQHLRRIPTAPVGLQEENDALSFMCPTAGTTQSLLIEPHVAVRVIKGEIHNVLSVMRNTSGNQKYISPLRFTEELQDDQHPVIAQFQELHVALSEWDLRVESHYSKMKPTTGEGPPPPCTPDALLYLPPFCAAVQGREISAPVTGAALSALHKFLIYGFISPKALHASAGMTMIAQALLHCTFEESNHHHESGGGAGGQAAVISAAAASSVGVAGTPDDKHHVKSRQNHGSAGRSSSGDGTGAGGGSSSRSRRNRRHGHHHYESRADDEQVVLKLLDLAALVVRCSFLDSIDLISSDRVVGLLDTCLHVSHIAKSASPLLRSAAADALAQIVLQVFAGKGQPVVQARQEILAKLASLLNPATHSEDVIISSLTAVNIALETCREELTRQEIAILQNDLCKYLLQWSTTHDLFILSLTLRVIFNLFQTIRNHLKVPLEVFLTSVHLRILEIHYTPNLIPAAPSTTSRTTSTTPSRANSALSADQAQDDGAAEVAMMMMSVGIPEEREVALESLLEFCQEPALMQDIYLNYDCDVACTNLYEAVVSTLGKNCMPMDWKGIAGCRTTTSTTPTTAWSVYIPATANRSPSAAAAAAVAKSTPTENGGSKHSGSIGGSRRIPVISEAHILQQQQLQPTPPQMAVMSAGGPSSVPITIPVPLNHLNRLALEGMLAILSSIARRVHNDRAFVNSGGISSSNNLHCVTSPASMQSMASSMSDDGVASSSTGVSDEELHLRRRKKAALAQIAEAFNKDPMGRGWIDAAVREQLLESADSAAGVAELLYMAPGIDKVKSGEYLSKGPVADYPFQAEIRYHFVRLYDFTDLTFASSLRLFLTKFRLPGEAQCIDRFMECFSTELYRQHGESSIFKNADAVYVMSFSTIMLNTDLHNPTIKEENRMTLDQFIRNNRGINGGEDMPRDFLVELYQQIKAHQIQVQLEVGELFKQQENDDFRTAWDSILSKHKDVATPFFTSADMARRTAVRTSVHDKEMFYVLAKWALKSLPAIFMRSWDDGVVLKALKGLKQVAMIADYFGVEETVNDVLQILLSIGRDYVVNCITLDHANAVTGMHRSIASISDSDEGDETTVGEGDQETPIPYSLLSSGKGYSEVDISGAAGHRGLLALDTGFVLVRKYARQVKSAWPSFIECLCVLRDARALPAGLSDLDDFADSNGNVLPLSPYAKTSQRRLDDFYRTKSDSESEKKQSSWFQTLFKKKGGEDDEDDMKDDSSVTPGKLDMSPQTRALLAVAEAADVEHVVQMGSTKLPSAEEIIQSLMEVVDGYPFEDDPVAEQHAIFSLELAARALLSNRNRATELFPLFLIKFESIFGRVTDKIIPSPFVIERIVVTILRCSIHLYDIPQLRPNLRVSLHLPLMSVPKSFLRDIADRMACGLAIILRASFNQFESINEWTFMGDTLDMLANYGSARVFVFDGIASTVEYALPQYGDNKSGDAGGADGGDEHEDPDRPSLSKEACGALSRILIRFVLGFYRADTTLAVPAMVCLEKLYRRMTAILISEMEDKPEVIKGLVPNKDLWQNVAVAVYSVCRSPDPETSRHGYECCQRVILRTPVKQIPHEKWIAMLYLIVSKQPPTAAHLSRANTFVLLGNLMMRVAPALSKREENRDDLQDLIHQLANLAQENFRHGRRGRVSPLFEKTVQTVTYLSNHMQTDDWKGDSEFGKWAGEILLSELEKVGAAGAALKNQAAVKKRQESSSASSPSSPQHGSKF